MGPAGRGFSADPVAAQPEQNFSQDPSIKIAEWAQFPKTYALSSLSQALDRPLLDVYQVVIWKAGKPYFVMLHNGKVESAGLPLWLRWVSLR